LSVAVTQLSPALQAINQAQAIVWADFARQADETIATVLSRSPHDDSYYVTLEQRVNQQPDDTMRRLLSDLDYQERGWRRIGNLDGATVELGIGQWPIGVVGDENGEIQAKGQVIVCLCVVQKDDFGQAWFRDPTFTEAATYLAEEELP